MAGINTEEGLFSSIQGVLEGRSGLLVDGVLASVPLGHHALLLELRVLAPVVDGGEDLPHEQQCQTNSHNGTNYAKDDTKDIQLRGALKRLLHAHHRLPLLVVAVHEGEAAVVLIKEGARLFAFLSCRHVHFS